MKPTQHILTSKTEKTEEPAKAAGDISDLNTSQAEQAPNSALSGSDMGPLILPDPNLMSRFHHPPPGSSLYPQQIASTSSQQQQFSRPDLMFGSSYNPPSGIQPQYPMMSHHTNSYPSAAAPPPPSLHSSKPYFLSMTPPPPPIPASSSLQRSTPIGHPPLQHHPYNMASKPLFPSSLSSFNPIALHSMDPHRPSSHMAPYNPPPASFTAPQQHPSTASTAATTSEDVPLPYQSNSTYELVVAQQPCHARICGFGEKDRRPIDPPPFVQVIVRDRNGNIEKDLSEIPFYIVHASLYAEDGKTERILIRNGNQYVRALMGSTASSCRTLNNTNREQGLYFLFPDLSVRIEGQFRLRFVLLKIGGYPIGAEKVPSNLKIAETTTPVMAEVLSDVFSVYSVKQFPGMRESTELSKCFAAQGIKIPIRQESRSTATSRRSSMEEEDSPCT